MMDCHRTAPRRRVFKAASIEFGRNAIDCIVRNISETGAALDVNSPLYFPDRFTLPFTAIGSDSRAMSFGVGKDGSAWRSTRTLEQRVSEYFE
jgi:hypothetical protein